MKTESFMNLAHRGASAYCPENTLAAFYKAIELGANGLETDLHASGDGTLFLLHDDTLDRTTDMTGKPGAYSWSQLEQADAGSWFDGRYKGERLLEFDRFLRYFGHKDLFLVIELKDENIEEATLELIRRHRAESRTTVTSFRFDRLVRMRELDGAIPLALLTQEIDAEALEKSCAIGARMICPNGTKLSRESVGGARRQGLKVRAWKIGDEATMERVYSLGVDGMTVNFPDRLNEMLTAVGQGE